MQIFGFPTSPYVRKVLLIAAEKGVDVDLVEATPHKPTPEFLAASPFRMESAAFCARLYLGDENPTNPLASAVYADLSGLPPLSIHTSRHDMHFDDAVKLAENAHRDGADVKMNYWDTPRHHLERLKTKDAEASFKLAARFIRRCTKA